MEMQRSVHERNWSAAQELMLSVEPRLVVDRGFPWEFRPAVLPVVSRDLPRGLRKIIPAQ